MKELDEVLWTLDALEEVCYVEEVKTGKMLYMNDEAKRFFGVNQSTYLGDKKNGIGNLFLNEYGQEFVRSSEVENIMKQYFIVKNKQVKFMELDANMVFCIKKHYINETVENLSYIDLLTGIYNRKKYVSVLEKLKLQLPRTLGVVFADIDGLRKINRLYGDKSGDKIIVETAKLMKKYFRRTFRVGGNEFVGIMVNKSKEEFDKKIENLKKHNKSNDGWTLSVGSVWENDNLNISKMVYDAHELMAANKQIYYRDMFSKGQSSIKGMQEELLKSISKKEFMVYLQPKVDLENGKVIGAEALVRKKGSRKGELIYPDNFIEVYEKEGVISHLDLFVFEKVCSIISKWKQSKTEIPISVNFSRVSLLDEGIHNKLIEICEKYNVEPYLIDIEITERIGNIPEKTFIDVVRKLKNSGFSLSLDDFGSGYSNFFTLAKLDFTEVKIDKSLVSDISINKKNQIIIENVINMCNSLGGIKTVAEGIEREEQAFALRGLKCEKGQGYLYARPMPVNEFQKIK